ncbi:MAG: NADH-quinone oxidoreductase subunit NuoF [Oscillospiraceae bacterium]|jgi:NADH-quinone oxidoreductase subunit F|nr:NADH-quinone oxidoreductase subunit NuoF [Oscillospiraceae bacterium]
MKVTVGKGSCGIAAGAGEVYSMLSGAVAEAGLNCPVTVTGCIGACYLEPIVNVEYDDGQKRIYVKVDADGAAAILAALKGDASRENGYLIPNEDLSNINFQTRIALKNCGLIDPENIDEYIGAGGYKASEKCVKEMLPEQVIEEIKISGLCGRGGAGFPAWFKWNAARTSPGGIKYIICNADEGDPGAFMDRAVIEGDPHALIEGMIIAAYAIGYTGGAENSGVSSKTEGIVYVRAEYPLAIVRLENALKQARDKGMLGENIFGTDFSFDIRIKAGAGAFVCGEETALIASLEGERGMPRLKPPFPAQRGYWQKPSNINNVETYANVPWIIRNGGMAFAAIGTENAKGTKVFALTGKIAKGGLVEVPMGRTIREVVYGVGGGIKQPPVKANAQGGEVRKLKAVQMGGPSGGCIPAELLDTKIEYKTLMATGAIMGSGGMVVMDDTTCMVDMARYFLDFTCKESCGKCTHCRIGNRRMLEILDRICDGKGRDGDIELLTELAQEIKDGSLCALGQSAPNPVLTTIRYFRNEYEDHIINKKCTAHSCKPLIKYVISTEKCTGCTLCAKKCPVNTIEGELKSPHKIIQQNCIKCGKCKDVCRFNAVMAD